MLTSFLASAALVFSLQAQAAGEPEQDPVADTEASATEAVPDAEPESDENTVICRRTQIIGSKFSKRLCATRAEWENKARRDQAAAAEMQKKGKSVRQAGT